MKRTTVLEKIFLTGFWNYDSLQEPSECGGHGNTVAFLAFEIKAKGIGLKRG